jgi:hypothetical protein
MGITNEIITRTTGDNDDAAQVFVENFIVEAPDNQTSPFNFEVPVYRIQGATYDFYAQNTDGISASLNNAKSVTLIFTANTDSLTGLTQMIHSVYRLENEIFSEVVLNQTGSTFFEDAVSALTQPITTIIEDVSGSTFVVASAHTLNFPVRIKPEGQFTQNLMMDKSQYFVDSRFFFPRPVDITLGEVQTISAETGTVETLYVIPTGSTEFLLSSGRPHQVSGGTFGGITVNGYFFTYFVPPQKPDIDIVSDEPSVIGSLPTFAPIFSFNNVDDGDAYKLQVSYNTGDTSFTGATSIFNIKKQDGDAEFIRTFSKSLNPNANFLYRIGNVKEIINLFGVKQNITTWGRHEFARTSNDGQFELSGHTYKSIIGGAPVADSIITITVLSTLFSNIDLGSDVIDDPELESELSSPLGGGIGTQTTVVSDSNGFYSFGRINGGTYLITATNPSFSQSHSLVVTITQATNIDFLFSIVWGDTTVTFLDLETFI